MVNTGNHAFGFEIREPADWNEIFFVTAFTRDLLTGGLDVPHREPKFFAQNT
jgi:hypothetical protein